MILQDVYEAQRAGASKAELIAMIEELEQRGEHVPPELIFEIHELVDDEELEAGSAGPSLTE
jgi:hypothetical protein